jgi:hypothetical protein
MYCLAYGTEMESSERGKPGKFFLLMRYMKRNVFIPDLDVQKRI